MAERDAQGAALLTALHGDVVGYSALTADNEIETYNTLQVLRRVIEEEIATHNGELASFVGDEFLGVLATSEAAVATATAIQRRIAVENDGLPDGRKMQFRLGIHTGTISNTGDRWYGDGINIAARLQALADPGGINISREAFDSAGDVAMQVESLGPTRLKNIPEQVTIFRLIDDNTEADGARPWRRRIPTSDRPSLAVSPFVNYGSDEDSHFADGMMMALVIALEQIPSVDIISGFSTLGYRDQSFSAQQLGHELGVRYVLEGAVQRSGPKVRVLAQLIDVSEGRTAWADRFDASLEDVFTAQDDIVASIATALDVEVIGGDVARMYRQGLPTEAVEVLYRGLQHLSNGSPAEIQRAIESFETVTELSPDTPTGYTSAALAYVWMAMFEMTDDIDRFYDLAEERARQAIDRDDVSGIGQMVLGQIQLRQHDWKGALEAVEEATQLRPSCDLTYGVAASVMRYLGDWERSVSYAARAAKLSPLFATWYRSITASAELMGENYSEAADAAEGVVAENEDDVDALLILAAAQSALGRERHATAAIAHARETRPGLNTESLKNLPYRDAADLDRFIEHLQAAGLE